MNAFVAGLLCLLFGADQASALSPPASETPLILSSHPVENSSDLQLRLESSAGSNSVAIPLFLRQTGMTAISDVRLVGQLTAQGGGPVPRVEFVAVTNTTAMPPWSVPPAGKQWLLNMTVTGLTADGRYIGTVYADQAGTLHRLATLTVERLPKPELAVIGTEANKKTLTVTSPIATVAFPVQIESRNLAPVRDLKLVTARFTDSEGRSVVPKWTVGEQALAEKEYGVSPRGVLNLRVQAEFPIPGTYKSTLSLSYSDKQESLELVVKRERIVLPVEIHGPVRADGVLGRSGHGPTVWLALQETLLTGAVVNLPQIVLLTAKSTAQDRQVAFLKATVRGDDGQVISTDITLKPGELKRFQLELVDVTEPGELTALVRVTSADHAPRDHTVTLLTKRSVWCAGFWILLGVGISLWLRHYRGDLRPRLQAQQRAARLRRDLQKLATDDAALLEPTWQRILDEYVRRLDQIDLQLIDGASTEIDSRMAAIEQKLPLFHPSLVARQRISSIEPASIRKDFDDRLLELQDFLGAAETDATKLKGFVAWLEGLDSAIEPKVRGELQRQISEFQTEVEKANLPDEVKRSVLQAGGEAQELLNQPGKLLEAYEKMVHARRLLLTQAVKAWNDSARADDPAVGFTPEEWNKYRQPIAEELIAIEELAQEHLDRAIAGCQKILEDYYQTLVRKLSLAVKDLGQKISDAEKLTDEKKQNLKTELEAKSLQPLSQETLKSDFETRRYAAIVEKYDQAATALRTVEADFRKAMGGGVMGPVSTHSLAGALKPTAIPFLNWSGLGGIRLGGSAAVVVEIYAPPTIAEIDRKAQLFHWGTQFLIAGVAVLLGTQWIWANSPTWGTWSDYIAALLLGLGVHQVGDKKLDIDSLLAPKA